jgi:indolepyruvate ferredoxin oxidoreductase
MGTALRKRPGRGHARLKTAAVIQIVRKPSLAELVERRAGFLNGYQDAAWAARYRATVERVRAAEASLGGTRLAEAVARNLFKLMAYKDEYEVARLHTDPAFVAGIAERFEGDWRLVHHLAPPLLARRDARGELVKRTFGAWVRPAMRLLARLKGLRGTAFDPFGRTAERREERALIALYEADLANMLGGLDAASLALAVEIASLPEQIRGFGHVKSRNLAATRTRRDALWQRWREAGVAAEPAQVANTH